MDPALTIRALQHGLTCPWPWPDLHWLERQFDQGEWGGMEEPVTLFDTAFKGAADAK